MRKIDYKKYDGLLNDIYSNTNTGVSIAKKYEITPGRVSQIKKRLKKLKYIPMIKDNRIACAECGIIENLVIHHNHLTGQPITILCRRCNIMVRNNDFFDGCALSDYQYNNSTDNTYVDMGNGRMAKITITIDKKLNNLMELACKELDLKKSRLIGKFIKYFFYQYDYINHYTIKKPELANPFDYEKVSSEIAEIVKWCRL